jgi:tRNA threonylcarbamoyladenosine biosynthesis protein TsaB
VWSTKFLIPLFDSFISIRNTMTVRRHMKILALDTSGLTATVALAEDDILIAEYTIQYQKTHSQTLLPMLDSIQQNIALDLHTIDAIAVASGPGSFTGLRIGAATAKGLGFALGKPLVEVPTLEALAYRFWGSARAICPLMDARRGQVYTGLYTFSQNQETYDLQTLVPGAPMDIKDILALVNAEQKDTIFLGDGVPVYIEEIQNHTQVPYAIAPAHMNRQSAAAVAALGAVYVQQGLTVTPEDFVPKYFRLSQAEREEQEARMDLCS